MLDKRLAQQFFISGSSDECKQLVAAIGSTVPGTDKADTRFEFGFLERAGADQSYIDRLIKEDIVSREFVEDVLMVDFTRPLLSDDRCDLLALGPELAAKDRTAANMALRLTTLNDSSPTGPAARHARSRTEFRSLPQGAARYRSTASWPTS